MVHGGEQERSKAALLAIGVRHPIVLEEAREELLRQVLGVLRREAPAAHVSVKGIPVSLAELLQRAPGAGGVAAARSQHDRPVRGDKDGRAGRGLAGCCWF